MPAVFTTLGPYDLGPSTSEAPFDRLSELWDSPRGKGGPIPRLATGVYVLAVKDRGKLMPVYVGKSDRGFAKRLHSHTIFSQVAKSYLGMTVYLFLLARVTPKKKSYVTMKKIERSDGEGFQVKRSRANTELEFMLIGSCLRLNPELLNLQGKTFMEGLKVPGFLGRPDSKETRSAIAFEAMMKAH